MDARSIKEEVIGLLTQHRDLTSAERAEIDTLGLALSLRDNDPMWGSVIWAWAVVPRKEWLDVAHRALAAEIRSDIKEIVGQGNSLGGHSAHDDSKLDAIKTAIEALSSRHTPAAPATMDPAAIHKAVISALDAKKGFVSVDEILRIVKDVAREFISWTNAAVAAVVVGLCLFIGYQFGQYVQKSGDNAQIETLQKQVSDLTSAVAHNK